MPELESNRAFLEAWQHGVYAWPPEGRGGRVAEVSAGDIRAAYRSGSTIYCLAAEKRIPALTAIVRELERDLGLRRGDMTCQAILSKAGYGSQAHFDADCTFNLQIHGMKKWQVAPNDSAPYPHQSRMMVERMSSAMATYAVGPFPAGMPGNGKRFTTRAGGIVYLPHGCWHVTTCQADSLALLFVVPGPKWYELFLREIEGELIKVTEARKLSFIGPRSDLRSAAAIVEHLKRFVARFDAGALVTRWAGPDPVQFRRTGARPPKTLKGDDDLAATLKWLEEAPDVLCAADLADAFPARSPSAVIADLATLVYLKLIEAAD